LQAGLQPPEQLHRLGRRRYRDLGARMLVKLVNDGPVTIILDV
jgi:D-Tyr-tRNAtyr deacylase